MRREARRLWGGPRQDCPTGLWPVPEVREERLSREGQHSSLTACCIAGVRGRNSTQGAWHTPSLGGGPGKGAPSGWGPVKGGSRQPPRAADFSSINKKALVTEGRAPRHSWLSARAVPPGLQHRRADVAAAEGVCGDLLCRTVIRSWEPLAMWLWDTPDCPVSPAGPLPPGTGLRCWKSQAPPLTAMCGHLGASLPWCLICCLSCPHVPKPLTPLRLWESSEATPAKWPGHGGEEGQASECGAPAPHPPPKATRSGSAPTRLCLAPLPARTWWARTRRGCDSVAAGWT